ncbi:MAG TPA: DDE transposase, partial [Verrucomicrobiales bacterium]|nr:DDE transposase [Verrucomicrobiales bacterium]
MKSNVTREVVADKGYHSNQFLSDCNEIGVRTYIPEKKIPKRRWTDKSAEQEKAYRNNRRRVRSDKGKRLNRKRGEIVERTFAHVCNTGGGRRTWLRG